MTPRVQYIIIFIILGAVIAWLVYKLVKGGSNGSSACAGCTLSSACSKKELKKHTDKCQYPPKKCR